MFKLSTVYPFPILSGSAHLNGFWSTIERMSCALRYSVCNSSSTTRKNNRATVQTVFRKYSYSTQAGCTKLTVPVVKRREPQMRQCAVRVSRVELNLRDNAGRPARTVQAVISIFSTAVNKKPKFLSMNWSDKRQSTSWLLKFSMSCQLNTQYQQQNYLIPSRKRTALLVQEGQYEDRCSVTYLPGRKFLGKPPGKGACIPWTPYLIILTVSNGQKKQLRYDFKTWMNRDALVISPARKRGLLQFIYLFDLKGDFIKQ